MGLLDSLSSAWQSLGSPVSKIVGGLFGNQKDPGLDFAKKAAKNQIQWKVADARKAGVHPLYALGAPSFSPSVSSVGSSLASDISSMGQDISRAMDTSLSSGERQTAYQESAERLNLQRLGLENELLASQIKKINQAGHPPSVTGDRDKILIAGQQVIKNPGWSDAQVITDRYGEPAEWVYSPFVAAADAARNVPRLIRGAHPSTRKRDKGDFSAYRSKYLWN